MDPPRAARFPSSPLATPCCCVVAACRASWSRRARRAAPRSTPITQHLERLLARGARFVACHADMNHFKPFNDQQGYGRGDEMIRLAARLALTHCDPQQDVVGPVGGDDFSIRPDGRVRFTPLQHPRCSAVPAAAPRRCNPPL